MRAGKLDRIDAVFGMLGRLKSILERSVIQTWVVDIHTSAL